MRYFSMFSGIGGFELGIQTTHREKNRGSQEDTQGDQGQGLLTKERKGASSENGRTSQQSDSNTNGRATCIGYSEIDKYAIQVYQKHFKEHDNYGDCAKIDWKTVGAFDCLVGGFPCQAFSIAGRRGGFGDTRGTLFFEIARCLREKQPRICILENVKGLLSHDKGSTFFTVLTTLDELGYDLQWQLLNSKNFGVPQNRERVFIIGHLRGTSRPEVFPIPQSGKSNLKYCAGVVSAREKWLKTGKNYSREFSQGQRIYSTKGIAQTLAGNAGGQGGKTGLYQLSPTVRDEHHNTENVHFVPEGMNIRRLTPKECERLQGFPDGWTEGISDTQRYKCLGNAVTVNVVQAIAERLL